MTPSDGEIKEIDARPSDSIALALRTEAPIFVAKSVLSKSGIRPSEDQSRKLEVEEMESEAAKVVKSSVFLSSAFKLDLQFQSELDKDDISDELRQELESKGISLSDDAAVSCTSWQIKDKDKIYLIKKEGDKLNWFKWLKGETRHH